MLILYIATGVLLREKISVGCGAEHKTSTPQPLLSENESICYGIYLQYKLYGIYRYRYMVYMVKVDAEWVL